MRLIPGREVSTPRQKIILTLFMYITMFYPFCLIF